jgi:hypothetical protein
MKIIFSLFLHYLRANLSNDYFVNRQDRYIVIKNSPKLCDFFETIINSISEFSFKVDSTGNVTYQNLHHPFEGTIKPLIIYPLVIIMRCIKAQRMNFLKTYQKISIMQLKNLKFMIQ